MKLAQGARSRTESKRDIKGSVPSRLNQDQLRECQHMLVFPDMQVFELKQFCLKLGRQVARLIKLRRPEEIVIVDCLRVDSCLLVDIFVIDVAEGRQIMRSFLRIPIKPGQIAGQDNTAPALLHY